jgi:predicted AAA+ superfamily ATPase
MMTPVAATDVFTPSAFPKRTYVRREEDRLERRLRDALETPGEVISVSGPSKSGKTVLVERVVGEDKGVAV